MADKAQIVIVAALARKSRVIGKGNGLLWHIPDDMKRFRELTANHPVIMGRKTFESILSIIGKPLPGRPNIVVTRNTEFSYPDVIVCSSLNEALLQAKKLDTEEIHIGGGAEIYKQVLPLVDRLHLTLIDDEPKGDTYFPKYEDQFEATKAYPIQEHQGIAYQWVDYVRKKDATL